MFFHGWEGIGRTLIVGALAYGALIVVLRLSGKRTLAKMNAFDFVVTVALGSTLATILLSKSVALAEGITALALLVALQYAVAWLSAHTSLTTTLVKSTPTLLLERGKILPEALEEQRVVEAEVLQAIRSQGIGDLEQVAAVVLETDGTFSVIPSSKLGQANALANVAWNSRSRAQNKNWNESEPAPS